MKGIAQKIFTGDYNLTKAQEMLAEAMKTIGKEALLNGVIVEFSITSPATDTIVEHKLARDFRGWFCVGKFAQSDIYESTTVNANKHKYLILKGSAAVDGALYVF